MQAYFDAIKRNDKDKVRQLLLQDKSLTNQKFKDPSVKYDNDIEIDAYKFLGMIALVNM
jgi:ketosteroid isomerase-like protein